MADPLSVSEIAPPFPLDLVDLQLLNDEEEEEVPLIEMEPPESDPLTALLPALLYRSLNVQVVTVTLGDPLNASADALIDTAVPLVLDPNVTLVSVSVPPLSEKTGLLREDVSVKVSEENETVVEEDERVKCAGDAPLRVFIAEFPVTVTVFPEVNVVEESVGCVDPVLRMIVKDESAKMVPAAIEYAALMVVQLVFELLTQKESRALVVVGAT